MGLSQASVIVKIVLGADIIILLIRFRRLFETIAGEKKFLHSANGGKVF